MEVIGRVKQSILACFFFSVQKLLGKKALATHARTQTIKKRPHALRLVWFYPSSSQSLEWPSLATQGQLAHRIQYTALFMYQAGAVSQLHLTLGHPPRTTRTTCKEKKDIRTGEKRLASSRPVKVLSAKPCKPS